MGIYVIALYFGNSLGPIFTGVIAESWSPRDNTLPTVTGSLTVHRGRLALDFMGRSYHRRLELHRLHLFVSRNAVESIHQRRGS
jgi:hypothetical protein